MVATRPDADCDDRRIEGVLVDFFTRVVDDSLDYDPRAEFAA
jgi:hypothetical protein